MKRSWVVLGVIMIWALGGTPAMGGPDPIIRKLGASSTSCKSLGRKILEFKTPKWFDRTLVGGAAVGITGWMGVYFNVHHRAWSLITGAPHIGFGIYLDMDGVNEKLDADDTALLDDPEKNEEEIVLFLIDYLEGDDEEGLIPKNEGGTGTDRRWYSPDYATGRRASEFLKPGKSRGVCRHKAVVMAEVLKKWGIPAEYHEYLIEDKYWHAVVYLPRLNKYADPMNGKLWTPEDFDFIVLHPSRGKTKNP